MDFILRPWEREDAPSLARYADNEKIGRNLRDGFPYPYRLEDAETFIASACEDAAQIMRAIVVCGEAVGGIGVHRRKNVYRRTGEIGYWLGEPFWGRGIVSRAAAQLCREVFETTDMVRIEAGVFAFNGASARVLEKAGFTLEGRLRKSVFKNGEMHDSLLFALIKP
ncbi:MAG: GNAT family N-acetyltransferase [Christensenellales bacterium]|jgi:ribosomal-protein-alanine N-acetyltransferase